MPMMQLEMTGRAKCYTVYDSYGNVMKSFKDRKHAENYKALGNRGWYVEPTF